MSESGFTFSAVDYVVFGLMLLLSVAIGIYNAYRERNSNSANDYLNATKSMSMLPVAISLCVTYESALNLLSTPAEIYLYGSMASWGLIATISAPIIAAHIFMPTYYAAGITSVYDYLRLRFNRVTQILGTLTFMSGALVYSGVNMYAPAIAFEAVSGLNTWASILACGVVCILYTTFGGFKGIVWTDVFQSFVIVVGVIAVVTRGVMINGGFAEIWNAAYEGGRIDFVHFETDVRIRHTFWSVVIDSLIVTTASYGTSQPAVQRFFSCKSLKDSQMTALVNIVGHIMLYGIAFLLAIVAYAHYRGCDPLEQGCISKIDQIIPLLVMDVYHNYYGIPGLFLACIFAATLSTISSTMNALASAAMDNIVTPYTKFNERTQFYVSKGMVFFFGVVCIGIAALMTNALEIYEAALSLISITMGPLLGLFTLGMQFPFANWKGASGGVICGIASGAWLYLGRKSITQSNDFVRAMDVTTDQCNFTCNGEEIVTNYTTLGYWTTPVDATTIPEIYDEDVPFYTLSFRYISATGFIGCIISGCIISLLTGGWRDRHKVNPKLLRPLFDLWIFRIWIPEKVRKFLRFGIEWSEDGNDDKFGTKSEKYRTKETSGVYSVQMDPGNVYANESFVDDKNAVKMSSL
ncbi:sodium-coupled monocarboxylate transporter 1-like [Styela clava]